MACILRQDGKRKCDSTQSVDSSYGNKQRARVIIAKTDTDFISILITTANILYHRA